MTSVRIMRGPPGSGKSFYAENCAATELKLKFNGVRTINSADHFFVKDGIYSWNPKQIGIAHKTCREKFAEALQVAKDDALFPHLIVVDNTNTTAKEIRFYYELALEYTNDVQIVEVCPAPEDKTKWVEDCAERNQHGVPLEAIQRMQKRLDNPLPKEWNRVVVERHDGYFIRKEETGDVKLETSKGKRN